MMLSDCFNNIRVCRLHTGVLEAGIQLLTPLERWSVARA